MTRRYRPLPEHCWIRADQRLGRELLAGGATLRDFGDEELYGYEIQDEIRHAVRGASPAGFDQLIARIEEGLAEAPFALVVRGIPFDVDERLFVATCRALGEMIAPPLQKPRAQLVHRIQPSTDLTSSRGAFRESERLHTDCADWPEPSRYLAMTCVRPDPFGGGDSLVLDMEALRDELLGTLGPEAVATLCREAVPWRLAAYQGGDVIWQPVLGDRRLRWRRYTVDAALGGEVRLSAAMTRLLDDVERTIEMTGRTSCFRLERGDLLVMDNHRAIHGRTALGDPHRVSDRLMLRSWIRPLAPPAATASTVPG